MSQRIMGQTVPSEAVKAARKLAGNPLKNLQAAARRRGLCLMQDRKAEGLKFSVHPIKPDFRSKGHDVKFFDTLAEVRDELRAREPAGWPKRKHAA